MKLPYRLQYTNVPAIIIQTLLKHFNLIEGRLPDSKQQALRNQYERLEIAKLLLDISKDPEAFRLTVCDEHMNHWKDRQGDKI